MNDPLFLLASGSPRRRDLLTALGLPFQVVANPWDEASPAGEPAWIQVHRLAREKLHHFLSQNPQNSLPVLTADTLLSFKGHAINKPDDEEEAWSYYQRLAGHSHFVLTSFAWSVPHKGLVLQKTVKTKVTFVPWHGALYHRYLKTGEWKDAAGGYRIQGGGSVLVKKVQGSWTNVVGLPIAEVYDMIRKTLRVPEDRFDQV